MSQLKKGIMYLKAFVKMFFMMWLYIYIYILGSEVFSIADTASRTIIYALFWAMDQFLGETGSKLGNHFLFELFKISFI